MRINQCPSNKKRKECGFCVIQFTVFNFKKEKYILLLTLYFIHSQLSLINGASKNHQHMSLTYNDSKENERHN